MATVHDFSARAIDGKECALADFKGKALLIVNVASKCGFTPQYKGLESLQRKYADRGFAVLGFPCDQFGHQEPGNEQEIRNFCSLNYDVTFPRSRSMAVARIPCMNISKPRPRAFSERKASSGTSPNF